MISITKNSKSNQLFSTCGRLFFEGEKTEIYSPILAKIFQECGVYRYNEASILIKQLTYWISNSYGRLAHDGKRWIRNSYKEWVKQITLSTQQMGRLIRSLCSLGIIEKSKLSELRPAFLSRDGLYDTSDCDQTSYITINYDKLIELCKKAEIPVVVDCSQVNSDDSPVNDDDSRVNNDLYNKETSISTPSGAQEKENLIDVDPWEEVDQEIKLKQKVPEPTRDKYVWESDVGQPIALFQRWWANKHYKPQGGKWETAAEPYAYSEFYKNPERTLTTLFPLFLKEHEQIASNCNQLEANGIKAVVPSHFIPNPDPTEENVNQLKENLQTCFEKGAEIAVDNKSTTQSTRSVPLQQKKDIRPLLPLESVDNHQNNFMDVFVANRSKWRFYPHLREDVEAWAIAHSDKVKVTQNGIELT